ncbi:MAG TPA: hypothetical protein VIH99_06755 [Bdellovibrionota bacterium]
MRHIKLAPLLALVLGFPLFYANGDDSPGRCYRFTSSNLPNMEKKVSPRIERWCYQKISSGLYVYNVDGEKVKPELAFVKATNGVLTHGSLHAGKLTMHSLRYDQFNPFPVPLDEPTNTSYEDPPSKPDFVDGAKKVLAYLLLAQSPNPVTLAINEGVIKAESSEQPWRGYWWPNKGQPMVGPMSKYDSYVSARGVSGGAASWESGHHLSHGIWWEGHCNGWAAAAILRAEPTTPVLDSQSGVTFSVSDLKGIFTEADYCANASMFGHRYDGRGDDLYDIDAALFHRTLTYYIGNLHKPVAMDYRRDEVIDNHIVSGYSMEIEENSPTVVTVTATLNVHKYDGSRIEEPGVAPIYTRVYRYTLTRDSDGLITGGKWLSENPDFLWVPLSTGRCRSGNPNLDESMISGILR